MQTCSSSLIAPVMLLLCTTVVGQIVPYRVVDLGTVPGQSVQAGDGVLLLAATKTSVTLPGGCTLHVDLPTSVSVPLAFNPIGQGHAAFPIPGFLSNVSLFAQLASLDTGAPNGLFTLSNGVKIDLP